MFLCIFRIKFILIHMEITLSFGSKKMYASLFDTSTAHAIYKALPFKGNVQLWGNEAYFEIPVFHPLEQDASETVPIGGLAYWPQGKCFCVFWGQNPISAVNVFGKIHTNLDDIYSLKNNELMIVDVQL